MKIFLILFLFIFGGRTFSQQQSVQDSLCSVYAIVRSLDDGFYVLSNDNENFGIADSLGKIVLPLEYKFYTVDSNRHKIFAKRLGKSQIIDYTSPTNVINLDENINFITTAKHFASNEKFFQIFSLKGKIGLIDSDNNIMISPVYDEIMSSNRWDYFIVKLNDKYGIVDYQNNFIKKIKYDEIVVGKEKFILKKKGNKHETFLPGLN